MAHRIMIQFDDDVDLKDSSLVYNRIIALIAKQIGMVNVKSLELVDNDFRVLLDFRPGYDLPKAIAEWKENRVAMVGKSLRDMVKEVIEKNTEDSSTQDEEEVEDAKH